MPPYVLVATETTAGQQLTEVVDRKVVRVSDGQVPGLQLRDCFIRPCCSSAFITKIALSLYEGSPSDSRLESPAAANRDVIGESGER